MAARKQIQPRRVCPVCGLKGARALHERIAGEWTWLVGCVECRVSVRLTEDEAAVVAVVADVIAAASDS